MMQKKRSLGRGFNELGLDELLGEVESAVEPHSQNEFQWLPIDSLEPGRYQPRKNMAPDSLEELANSIRVQGIIQPLLVRPLADNRYEIIAGERRWRAARMALLSQVPAVIRRVSDETTLAMSLIENIQRQDLNAIEEANALQRLLDEFHMTHEAVAEAVGKSRVSVTNSLRLLKLNADVRHWVEQGQLEMGHARALLALEDEVQSEAAKNVIAQKLSVREAEQWIREKLIHRKHVDGSDVMKSHAMDPNIARLQRDLSNQLGAAVTLKHEANGKGKLIIYYHTVNELEGILQRMQYHREEMATH
ncbi:MAG: chromosome partitioning protein ParB [Coxiella sp. RIFCSPHIGHO2_12_FULL_44_14]|nr:MAG: chromosome partitioning protein ParB [Coxiella sp. RIFCSPHIGHO2_12_FULL_44_14]